MVYTQRARRAIKGCLEVKAIRDTRLGVSETIIPKGSIGYVMAIEGLRSPDGPTGYYAIYWADLKQHGSHHKSDVTATGRRG